MAARTVRRLALAATLASLVAGRAAAADALPEVPDPYGLGERLALIDWLHEHAIATPEAATVDDLRRLYADALAPKAPAPSEADAQRRDEVVRALWKRHSVAADAETPTDQLEARLAKLDEAFAATQARYQELATADDGDIDEPRAIEAQPAPKPATTAKPAAKPPQPAASDAIPPLDEAHRAEWLNYDSAPNATKDGVQLWVHLRKGDTKRYYIAGMNRGTKPATVQFTIDGAVTATITVAPGRGAAPMPVPCPELRSLPSIVVNSVAK